MTVGWILLGCFGFVGMRRLQCISILKQIDNYTHEHGLSLETWDILVKKLQKTQQTLFNTLNDSEADPEEFGKYNADVPLRQRSHLSEKNMIAVGGGPASSSRKK